MSAAIHATGLTRRFGSVEAVAGLELDVAPGEIYGIVGPDGAGKSTTLRMLASILLPSSGEASIMGLSVTRDADRIKDCIAYMSQQFGLYADLTVLENIEFYADLYGVPRQGRGARIAELLDFSYMQPFTRRLAGKLSGGMKQKLQLICALVHTPQVLLLDEPTNGVDPVSRRDFWRILYQLLAQGVTILLTTAYMDEAERCNRVGLLYRGRLIAQGEPQAVKRLMRGTLLEIATPEARAAAAQLRRAIPGAEVSLFGDRVHLVCAAAAEGERQARAALEAAGIAIEELRTVEPTLEDVFVSVLGGAEAADA